MSKKGRIQRGVSRGVDSSVASITELISQHILDVYEGSNWTEVNISDTLKNVSMEDAKKTTLASPNSIASIINHLAFWNRVMIQRIKGITNIIPDSNGFAVKDLNTEDDWQKLKEDNLLSAHELTIAILSFDINKLKKPILFGQSSAYKNLQGSVEHIHYHLGQIVILKHLVKMTE